MEMLELDFYQGFISERKCLAPIFTVPLILRAEKPSSFNPRVISIGPLHRKDESVQASEGWKTNYLTNLLSRINAPKQEILKSCMHKVYASMNKIKACYVQSLICADDAEIAEMMVMDACFILEFMLKIWESVKKSYPGRLSLVQTIMHDLMLLENQIPFFVLDEIFKCTILKFQPNTSIVGLLRPLLSCHNLFEADIEVDAISTDKTHHILDLLHQCYRPRCDNIIPYSSFGRIHWDLYLDWSYVTFEPNREFRTWMMWNEPKPYRPWKRLRMPVFRAFDHTELVLRNLIAYERSYASSRYITTYVNAMGMLVNTEKDVAKMIASGVLLNYMGSNEQVANMINNISKHDIAGVDSYYGKKRKTLSSCNMIALFAGIILFQTICTIISAQYNN